jgi:hypothetical protein
LPRLLAGEAVTLDMGYGNPGTFAAMFRRILGAAAAAVSVADGVRLSG